MAIKPMQLECDDCGFVKQETNKWYITYRRTDGALVIEKLNYQQCLEWTITPELQPLDLKLHHGDSCLIKYLSETVPSLHKEC